MAEQLTPLQPGTDQNQAVRFHSRERRRSLAGIPELFRTHRIYGETVMAVKPLDTDALFPDRTRPVTFKTAIRFGAGVHSGLIFEVGSATRGCGLGLVGNFLGFVAGESGTANVSFALFDNVAAFPEGLELELVAAVRPGDGRVRLWANGREIVRDASTSGTFNGAWADTEDGSFAASKFGGVPAEINAASGTPTNFAIIEPLSVYMGQVPRHFV